jgi:hypothetical protein
VRRVRPGEAERIGPALAELHLEALGSGMALGMLSSPGAETLAETA